MSLHDFLRFPGFRKKAVTLSYDDGMTYDARLIDLCDKHGLKCTFNLNSGRLEQPADGRRHTAESALACYRGSCHEIACHGRQHYALANVPPAVALNDVLQDRIALEKTFGRIVQGMAYAFGSFNDEAVGILRTCGIHYARTVVSTGRFSIPDDWLRMPATCHHSDPRLFDLAKTFFDDKAGGHAPKLFYVWGHTYEFEDNGMWDLAEKIAATLGGRDDVWYCTNGELYDYVRAFDRCECSVETQLVHNPTDIDVYVDLRGRERVIPAGKTVQL